MNYYNYDRRYDCHYNFNFAYYVKLVAFKSFSSSHPLPELCSEMHQRRKASVKFMPGSLLLYQWENPKLLQSTETLHIYDRGWTNTLCGNRTTGLNAKCVSPGVSSYNKYASEAFQYRNSSERPISTMASMVIDSLCNFSLNIYFLSLTSIFQIQLPFRRVSILSTGGRINSLFFFSFWNVSSQHNLPPCAKKKVCFYTTGGKESMEGEVKCSLVRPEQSKLTFRRKKVIEDNLTMIIRWLPTSHASDLSFKRIFHYSLVDLRSSLVSQDVRAWRHILKSKYCHFPGFNLV